MRNTRIAALVLMLALLAFIGSSISVVAQDATATPEPTPRPTVNPEKTVVELWTGSSSPAENTALEEMVAAYEEANPSIDVDLLISPDYGTQIQSALSSGDYPDVFAVGQFEFPTFVDSDVLMPADGRIVDQDDIYPGLLAAFTDADGTVYCPPKDFSTLGLLYNKDAFDTAGLDYPTAEWTWDDFRAAAEALTTEDMVGFSAAPDRNRWLALYAANAGAGLTDADGNSVINSAGAVEALDFYAGLVRDGFGATPSDLESGWNGEAFGRGRAAMTIEGNWAIGYLESDFPELNWGVAELPTAPSGNKGTLTFTVCWGVGANTDNPDEAWSLVNFLTGPEGAMMVAESGFGVLPARISAADAWLSTRGEEFAPFVIGGDYAWAPVFAVGFGDLSDAIDQGTVDVIAGDAEAQEALDEAAEIAQEIMEEMQ